MVGTIPSFRSYILSSYILNRNESSMTHENLPFLSFKREVLHVIVSLLDHGEFPINHFVESQKYLSYILSNFSDANFCPSGRKLKNKVLIERPTGSV